MLQSNAPTPEQLPEVHAIIVKDEKLLSDTWYTISVVRKQTDEKKHVMRRYEDFVELDQSLRALLSSGTEPVVANVPDLPSRGRWGIRASLASIGFGNFNEELKGGLQIYLDAICPQVPVLEGVQPLHEFFNAAITEQAQQQWDAPNMRQAIVKQMTPLGEEADPAAREVGETITEDNAAMMMVAHLQASLRSLDKGTEAAPMQGAEVRQGRRLDVQFGPRILQAAAGVAVAAA